MNNQLLVPKNFNAEKLLLEYPPMGYKNPIKPVHLYYIVSVILNQLINRYTMNDYNRANGFVPVNAKYLENILSKNGKDALNYLIEMKIVERFHKGYKAGVQSRLFRLDEKYTFCARTKMISAPKKMFDRIAYHKGKDNEQPNPIDKKRKYLFTPFKTKKISIEIRGALKWIKQQEKLEKENVKDNQNSLVNIKLKWEMQRKLVMIIFKQNFTNIHSDNFGFRFYTPITRLKSELRNFLLYDNEKLVGVDIKNCQASISLILLKPSFWGLHGSVTPDNGKELKLSKLDKELHCFMNMHKEEILSITILDKSSQTTDKEVVQIKQYIQDTTSGKLYEAVMKHLKMNENDKAERDKVKKQILQFMNEHPSQGKFTDEDEGFVPVSRVRKAFESLYKPIARLFDLIKAFRTGKYETYRYKYSSFEYLDEEYSGYEAVQVDTGYKKAASLLQRVETYLILDVICKELSQKWADIPLITIHDCIATTEAFVAEATSKIVDVFTSFIGYSPKVEIERWWID